MIGNKGSRQANRHPGFHFVSRSIHGVVQGAEGLRQLGHSHFVQEVMNHTEGASISMNRVSSLFDFNFAPLDCACLQAAFKEIHEVVPGARSLHRTELGSIYCHSQGEDDGRASAKAFSCPSFFFRRM